MLCPDCYTIVPDRDNYEYVYLTQDLINLSGKKFRQKKNNLNHFRNQYMGYEYLPITEDIFEECLDADKRWMENRIDRDTEGEDEDEMKGERQAIKTIFDNWDALGAKGGAIRIFNKIAAFSIGEMLNDDTAIIHFEKAILISEVFIRQLIMNSLYMHGVIRRILIEKRIWVFRGCVSQRNHTIPTIM